MTHCSLRRSCEDYPDSGSMYKRGHTLLKLSNVLKNLGSGTAARLLGALLGVLLAIYMARKWSVDAFGQYTIVFNYFQLLQQAPLLGLHILLARDAAARPDDRRSEMVTAGSLGL